MIRGSVDLLQLLDRLGAGAEADLLADAVVRAVDLAFEGQAPEGYEILLRGRHTQQEHLSKHLPWAAELMDGWQYALDRYAQEFGVGRA